MQIRYSDEDYVFEEYKAHIIASRKDNVPGKSVDNDIIVFGKKDFPEHGFIIGLDDSKSSGGRKGVPVNIEDAKTYIDWIVEIRQERELAKIDDYQGVRELPEIMIEGTAFVVDVKDFVLREKGRLDNQMSVYEMRDVGYGYEFDYLPALKNFSAPWAMEGEVLVQIREMVNLDPVGMAKKHSLSLEAIRGMSDFELMVDMEAYYNRISNGTLPVINIAGKPFEVDVERDMLRPKEIPDSKGIKFSDIKSYYDSDEQVYTIPYDPKRQEFVELNYAVIKELPKDIIVVSFPSERLLDRVGWNKLNGFDIIHGLKQNGLTMQFTATQVPWTDTHLPEIIRRNVETLGKSKQKSR